MNILSEIVEKKRSEIEAAKSARPLELLQKEVGAFAPERRPFRTLFEREPVLIAEIKPKSPSAGTLIVKPPQEVADLYAKSAADAISVLTDEPYFGGSLELLTKVRGCVPQTVFRKDFIIDEYQIYETLLSGADAFLLIANCLDDEILMRLMSLGEDVGLDYLLEVHDRDDVEKAIRCGARLIGINNRDLQSLKVDIETTLKLIRYIPKDIPVVSESGIETANDAKRIRAAGVRGILVGTSILRSGDPLAKINELKNALS